MTHRMHASVLLGALVLSTAAWGNSSPPLVRRVLEPDACALLDEAEVSKALEGKSLPGKRLVESNPKACIWSDDPKRSFDSRRVTVQYVSAAAFEMGKSSSGRITIETATGIGDEAYYEMFKADSPILVVRKGTVVLHVRILNGLKSKAFTLGQEKAKEAELAKAALAKL